MAILQKFSLFSQLPTELRLKIWKLVPQSRLLFLAPCSTCIRQRRAHEFVGDYSNWDISTKCKHANHPAWDYRWGIHPKTLAVPPVLHACHESRSVWLPKYLPSPKNFSLFYSTPVGLSGTCVVHFGSPFISYDTDVFAVLPQDPRSLNFNELGFDLQALDELGLDMQQIRHIAWFQSTLRSVIAPQVIYWTKLDDLPCLESLSILVTDFVVQDEEGSHLPGLSPETLQDSRGIRLAFSELNDADFFILPFSVQGKLEPDSPQDCHLIPQPPPLNLNANLVRAWLWHVRDGRAIYRFRRAEFENYIPDFDAQVSETDFDDIACAICELDSIDGYHTTGMIKWYQPPFELRWAMLCPMDWQDTGADSEDSDEARQNEQAVPKAHGAAKAEEANGQ